MVDGCVTYSIDDCRTRFFDLLQMVEFYQLNRGSLSTRLSHYIVSLESATTNNEAVCEKKSTSGSCIEVSSKSSILSDQPNLSLDSHEAVKISALSDPETSLRTLEPNENKTLSDNDDAPEEQMPVQHCAVLTTLQR